MHGIGDAYCHIAGFLFYCTVHQEATPKTKSSRKQENVYLPVHFIAKREKREVPRIRNNNQKVFTQHLPQEDELISMNTT